MIDVSKLKIKDFNPKWQYQGCVHISEIISRKNSAVLRKAKQFLLDTQIGKVIPKRYRHKIEWEIRNPQPNDYDELAMRGAVIWKLSPRKVSNKTIKIGFLS